MLWLTFRMLTTDISASLPVGSLSPQSSAPHTPSGSYRRLDRMQSRTSIVSELDEGDDEDGEDDDDEADAGGGEASAGAGEEASP